MPGTLKGTVDLHIPNRRCMVCGGDQEWRRECEEGRRVRFLVWARELWKWTLKVPSFGRKLLPNTFLQCLQLLFTTELRFERE